MDHKRESSQVDWEESYSRFCEPSFISLLFTSIKQEKMRLLSANQPDESSGHQCAHISPLHDSGSMSECLLLDSEQGSPLNRSADAHNQLSPETPRKEKKKGDSKDLRLLAECSEKIGIFPSTEENHHTMDGCHSMDLQPMRILDQHQQWQGDSIEKDSPAHCVDDTALVQKGVLWAFHVPYDVRDYGLALAREEFLFTVKKAPVNSDHRFQLPFKKKKDFKHVIKLLDKYWKTEKGFFSSSSLRVTPIGPSPDGKGESVPGTQTLYLKTWATHISRFNIEWATVT
eukprot:CAMPEP_0117447436 /NCGR_PEP_ID=MMETSP0759-20121206/6874_1 /TAXON_ID=63605 /ORGANISM="Percolomonas cosmopolitus, Strain WS" /LENGTH=285 /DNA_ID=CAMNT_0005239771 /DNA_START=1 /DNA_END=859 /DNA_ORIENTATION=+